MTFFSLPAFRRTMLALFVGFCSASQAQNFSIPADYYSRFGSISVVADTNAGIGVRDLPLPFQHDVRLSLVRAPTYWDYGLTFKEGVGEIRFGVFYSVLQFRAAYLPPEGMLFIGVVHGYGGEFAGGYAWRLAQQKLRVAAVGGLAFEGDNAQPYLQTFLSGADSRAFGPLELAVDGSAVATYFPLTRDLAHSYSGTVRAVYAANLNFSVQAAHYMQFAFGSAPLPKFEQYPAQVTTLSATYRFPVSGSAFELGAFKVGAARNWLLNQNSVGGNIYFRVAGLPALVGVTVSIVLNPDGSHRWVYGFASL